MAKLSVEQQNLIRELKKAYPEELRGLSDEQILTIYNEQLSQVRLNEDQQVSVMGLDVQSDDNMGLALQSTTSPQIMKMSDEEKEQLKSVLLNRINVTEDNVNAAKEKNGFFQKAWSGIKNTFNIGDSSEDVVKAKQEELKILNEKSIEEAFKEITGEEATEENLTKFLNGELKTKSEVALDDYVEGQGMVHDTLADMGSGMISFIAYTAAVAAAPVTGGLSIALGVGLATGVGAGSKLWIKSSQAKKRGEEYTGKDVQFDLITGAVSGILAPFTGGAGSAVGKTVAVKCFGMQVFKQAGKELVEEGVTTGFKQGFKNAMLNAAGYEYKGKTLGMIAAYGAEMATDGALSGFVENGFRTAYEGGDAKEVLGASISGFGSGLVLSPVVGGGMRGAGKATRWLVGKSPDVDAPVKAGEAEVKPKATQVLPPNVKSELATNDDLIAIHKIDKENFEGSYKIDDDFGAYKADLEERGVSTYTLKSEDGKIVGYYQLEPIENGELYVYSIGVPSELQKTRASYAALKKIQEEITKVAEEKGVKKVVLDVDADNKGLVKLYEKFGFKITGEDSGFEAGAAYHDYRMEIDVEEYYANKTQKTPTSVEVKEELEVEQKTTAELESKKSEDVEQSSKPAEKSVVENLSFEEKKNILKQKMKNDPDFPKNEICDILANTNEQNISLAEKLCFDKDFPKDRIAYILYPTNEQNLSLAEKLCFDKDFPKDKIRRILRFTNKQNISLAEKLYFDKDFPKDMIAHILYPTNEQNISLAEKLCFDKDFPKNEIYDILSYTYEQNLSLAEKLCYDKDFPKNEIYDKLSNTNEQNISLAEKLCFDKDFPKDRISDILACTNEQNISLAEKLCFDKDFPKNEIYDKLANTNEQNISLAEKLCYDKDFPKNEIRGILYHTNEQNISLAEKLCFDKDFPKNKIYDILSCTNEQNISLAEKLCFDKDFPKDRISDILAFTKERNISLAEKLCFDKDFPKDRISDILACTNEQNISLAEKLCFDPDFPKNKIGFIMKHVKKQNLSLAEKLCFDKDFPKDRVLVDILVNTKEQNIELAEKLCFDKDSFKDLIGGAIKYADEVNMSLAEKICYDKELLEDRELFEMFSQALTSVRSKDEADLYDIILNSKTLRENNDFMKCFKSILRSSYDKKSVIKRSELLKTFLSSEKLQKNELLSKHLGILLASSNSSTTMKNLTDYIKVLSDAFEKKAQLKSATQDISDEIITNEFNHKALDILSAVDMLGVSTFEASFSTKISGVKEMSSKLIDLRDRLEYRGLYQELLLKINPENSQKYRLLEKTVAYLKKTFPEVKASGDALKLKELQNEIATYTKEMQAIRDAKLKLSPQSIIEKVRVLAAIAQHNSDDLKKFVNLIADGTKENDAIWIKEVHEYIFKVLDMPYDIKLADKLNLAKSKYLPEILSANSDFKNGFKEILELMQKNPTKSLQEIFDELPQNIRTKEMFKELGIDYDKWCKADKNSFVEVEVELKLEESRKAAIDALEKEFNNVAFTSLPKAETDKIYAALNEIGVEARTVTENIYNLDGFISGTQEVVRFYKGGEPIKFEDLSKVMQAIKKTINDNEFWNVTYADDPQINSFRETMLTHFTKDRDIQYKTAKDLKGDKVVTLEIHKTDMNDISHSLFLGNHGSCCTAVGTGSNQFSAPTYIKNKMVSAIEVVDGDNFVGNTMCYIAHVDGKPALILDNIELKADYHDNDTIRDAIVEYAKKLCAEIGQPDLPIYAGPYRHKLKMEVYDFSKHQMQIVGNTADDDIYLDFITSGRTVSGNEVDEVELYKIR